MSKLDITFKLTEKINNLTEMIVEKITLFSFDAKLKQSLELRKSNRINSVKSTLAIENIELNDTDLYQKIQTKKNGSLINRINLDDRLNAIVVSNTFNAYKHCDKDVCYYSMHDFLLTHAIMMENLIESSGKFREDTNVNIVDSEGEIIDSGANCNDVLLLMSALFNWIKTSKHSILIKSCVAHYYIEIIHPFDDGNGRMGRLWQNVILASKWENFKNIPLESVIKDNQQEYYDIIRKCHKKNDCTLFIEFILSSILIAIGKIIYKINKLNNEDNFQVKQVIKLLSHGPMTSKEMMSALKIKNKSWFFEGYIKPSKEKDLIELTIPDKPKSKNQKYKLKNNSVK